MIKHYIKAALRNITKNKAISIISIIGYTIGLTCALLILLYVLNETSYDRHHKKRDRIYRVIVDHMGAWEQPGTQYILAPTMRSDFPEISAITRINWLRAEIKKSEDEYINEMFNSADNDIFKIFTIPFLQGNPESALNEPFSVVITESTANEYFENQDPLNKTLTVKIFEDELQLTVTGVIKEFPKTSTFKPEFIVPSDLAARYWSQRFNTKKFLVDWTATYSGQTYLLFPENYDPAGLETKFPDFEKTYLPEASKIKFRLQSLKDVYFKSSHFANNRTVTGNIKNVYVFSLIGFLILVIASINYTILSTARASTRSKEIGIRKVRGAGRKTLVRQILGESIITSFISLPLALLLAYLLLPSVNHLFRKELALQLTENWHFFTGFILLTLLVGLMSGSYLAFYLSSFQPVDVLKSKINTGISKSFYQKILITVQLVIFITLLLGTGIIFRQIKYAQNKDMGFNKEGLMTIYHDDDEFRKRYFSFKNEIIKHQGVVNVSGTLFGPPYNGGMQWEVPRMDDPDEIVRVEGLGVDFNYIETLEFEIIEGRAFSEEFGSDSSAIILNESAVKKLGIDDPIGQLINDQKIIGVIKDFHLHSFHTEIMPMIIDIMRLEYADEVVIRLNPNNISNTIDFIEEKWKEFAPDSPFEYSFFDDALKELYSDEQRFGKIVSLSTLIAVFIACIGMFGLSLFIGEQRIKEIGIRKVFGSSSVQVVKLILKQYMFMVLVGNLVAWPIAWFVMNRWLQNYAYRTNFEIWLFIVVAAVSTFIVLAAMTFQTVKAARTNPSETLKFE